MPNRSSLGVDRILSRYTQLLANQKNMFKADVALPTATTNSQRGRYYSVNPGFGYASPGNGLLRNSGASFRRVTTDVTQSALYELKEYGLEAPVDDIDREFAGAEALDLRQAAAEVAWNGGMIERERNFAGLMFNVTTFAGFTAGLTGGARWDDASSDPLDQTDIAVESIRQNTGVPRGEVSLLVGAKVGEFLRKNVALTDFYKNVTAGMKMLDEATIASALGIKEVIIANAVGNTSPEGVAADIQDIWGLFALFYHKVDAPRAMSPHGVGANFTLAGRQAGRVERYREEPRAEIALVSWLEDPMITTPQAGYLFETVVSP